MAKQTRFERLFGEEAEGFRRTPALIDVNPNLISIDDSKYGMKNLNRGRRATTGRHFRSPTVRSMESKNRGGTNFESPDDESGYWIDIDHDNSRDIGDGGGSLSGAIESTAVSGKSPMENRMSPGYRSGYEAENAAQATGDIIAGQLGTLGTAGATANLGLGIGLGVPNSMLADLALQGFVTTALDPVNIANVVGGSLVSGQMGFQEAGNLPGYQISEAQQNMIAAETAKETSSPLGLIGMGTRDLLAALGFGRSSRQIAADTSTQFGVDAHIANRETAFEAETLGYGGSHVGSDNAFYGGSDSALVGPSDTNEAISEAFGVDPAFAHEGSPATGPGSGLSNALADALASIGLDSSRGTGPGGLIGPGGIVSGLFGTGVDPHAPGPDGIGSSSGNFGGGGSSSGTTGVGGRGEGREGRGDGGDSGGLGGGPPGGPGDSGHGW